MDDNFQAHLNRVARLTAPDTYLSQLEHIQESPKFVRQSTGEIVPAPFPGYSVITPPCGEDADNHTFFAQVQECQKQLIKRLDAGVLIPVPSDSFHFTVADLIWFSAFRDAIKNPQFEPNLHQCIGSIFTECQENPPIADLSDGEPSQWMVLGMMVRTRAISICLVPTEEKSYQKVNELRRSLYQNSDLIALGIEQQYHFTAHITLGYFGEIPPGFDRDRWTTVLTSLNDLWLEHTQPMQVKRVELRKFDNMTRYYRQPDWPSFEF